MLTEIFFKTKPVIIQETKSIIMKKAVTKTDTNLKPHDHRGYNTDLFNHVVNRAYKKAINNAHYFKINELPSNIRIVSGTEKDFLVMVGVMIELND